jgi:hypothetical protein
MFSLLEEILISYPKRKWTNKVVAIQMIIFFSAEAF